MKVWIPALALAAALLGGSAAAAAPANPTPADTPPADDHQALERKLEEARARLEKAAKEVAELSVGMMPDTLSIERIVRGDAHPILGVRLGEPAPGGGVTIASVSPGGAADEAGLKAGDVITSVNGRRVANATEVVAQLHQMAPGQAAQIERNRAGSTARVSVTPRPMDPRMTVLMGDFERGMADFGTSMGDWFEHSGEWGGHGLGGLEIAALSPDLGRYFGTDKGVLVIKASPAFADKLKDGDVILSIGGREPEGVAHALRILRSYQPLEHVPMTIERDRKQLKLDLVMPERREPHPPHPPRPPRPGEPAVPPAPPAPLAPPGPPQPPQPSQPTPPAPRAGGAETV